MDKLIEQKIISAQKLLKELGMNTAQQNKISALTLLALCNLKPEDGWQSANNKSMTLSKDIMTFVNDNYEQDYKANSRESFRKIALRPFIENNIVLLNPNDPNLSTNSSLTHYALSDLVFNTIRKFETDEWLTALDNFLKFQSGLSEKQNSNIIIRDIYIENFKSIVKNHIELGRFNVFIGANGSGKSNILEVLACIGASRVNDLSLDGLNSRGVRYAQPSLMASSFLSKTPGSVIDVRLTFEDKTIKRDLKVTLSPVNKNDTYTKWVDLAAESTDPAMFLENIKNMEGGDTKISVSDLINKIVQYNETNEASYDGRFDQVLADYAIFDIMSTTLRGIANVESRKTPLGINGEGLDLLISALSKEDREYINNQVYFNWLEEIIADKKEDPKLKGLKPGRSKSNLYFTDKFMNRDNNTFSAENSNEGILHVLFYLTLFMSDKTPRIFAIDNIETALNPRLCRILIKELARLAQKNGKQVLITTHNPSILDGLNLMDDEQRLFEVARTDGGFTKTERINFKKDLADKPFRLSEMWVKGLLGAVPLNF